MKIEDGYDKLRGGYYTPAIITKFISDWAVCTGEDTVLEPSCGDGAFLEALRTRFTDLGHNEDLKKQVFGIELDEYEAMKALRYGASVINSDFFTYYKEHIYKKTTFDAIVGNPPFIRYQHVNAEFRDIAFSIMKENGLHPSKLTNIWLPFLILSALSLSKDGRLGMVIPAELFQVNYAGEARELLSQYFEKLTVVTFRKLVFDNIQQEIVILLGEKKSMNKGIQVLELDGLSDLLRISDLDFENYEVKELDHSSEKWVKYYLTNAEIKLMRMLKSKSEIADVSDLFDVNVGLVSGENSFFLLNQEKATQYKLDSSVKMIVGKTEQLKGTILTRSDFDALIQKKKRVYMFNPDNVPFEELSAEEQAYVKYGETQDYNKGYKCRIRKYWYCVPQSWEPDAFILRQVNRFPRIVLNQAGAVSTDTIHKVQFKNGISPELVASAFLNSFTLALSEITGRSYGGGVLTFEPGEIRNLKIPMKGAERLDAKKIDALIREDKIYDVLCYTDSILLKDGLKLNDEQIIMLRSIWEKLRDRRLSRKDRNKT